MAWYNAGDWSALDVYTVRNVYAELCNAINQRRDALGASRTNWTFLPTPTTSDLVATDFDGMALQREVIQSILDGIEDLIDIGDGFGTGWEWVRAQDSDTALDLSWVVSQVGSMPGLFTKKTSLWLCTPDLEWCRDALDLLLYMRREISTYSASGATVLYNTASIETAYGWDEAWGNLDGSSAQSSTSTTWSRIYPPDGSYNWATTTGLLFLWSDAGTLDGVGTVYAASQLLSSNASYTISAYNGTTTSAKVKTIGAHSSDWTEDVDYNAAGTTVTFSPGSGSVTTYVDVTSIFPSSAGGTLSIDLEVETLPTETGLDSGDITPTVTSGFRTEEVIQYIDISSYVDDN